MTDATKALFPEIQADDVRTEFLAELRKRAAELAPAGRNAFPAMCGTMSMNGGPEEPVGLMSEDRTLAKVAAIFRRMLDMAEGIEVYQPSNGTEGMDFACRWCERCAKDNLNEDTGEGGCDIIAYTMALDQDDEDYPRAWRIGPDGAPLCVEFEERK